MVDATGHGCLVCIWCGLDSGAKFRYCAVHLYSILGVLLPKINILRRLWAGWKRVGRKIGDFQARVLLTIIYATLVLPFGVIVHLFGDPLHVRRRPAQWQDHAREKMDLGWARKQG